MSKAASNPIALLFQFGTCLVTAMPAPLRSFDESCCWVPYTMCQLGRTLSCPAFAQAIYVPLLVRKRDHLVRRHAAPVGRYGMQTDGYCGVFKCVARFDRPTLMAVLYPWSVVIRFLASPWVRRQDNADSQGVGGWRNAFSKLSP